MNRQRKLMMAAAAVSVWAGVPAAAWAGHGGPLHCPEPDPYNCVQSSSESLNKASDPVSSTAVESEAVESTSVSDSTDSSPAGGLPVTGGDLLGLSAMGLGAIGAGAFFVRRSRRTD